MSILTKQGFNALKFSYFVLLAGIGVAVFLVVGSYLYWEAERKNDTQSNRTLSDMRSRLASAKKERDDLRDSEETYKALVARGLFAPEQRLDLLEAMTTLKARHQLNALEYDVTAQRPLKLQGANVSAIDVMGSRIRFKAEALHDGDIVSFLDEFPRLQRGLFPLDRCSIKRLDKLQTSQTVSADPDAPFSPRLEAECTLEWITLVDKRSLTTIVTNTVSSTPTGALPNAK